jgi:uncharacterized protein (TIGR00369 family)
MTGSLGSPGGQEVRRERTFGWTDPLESLAASAGRPGIEVLRDIASGVLPPPPIAVLMGFDLTVVEPGYAEFTLEPAAEFHYNPIGSVHGGVYATLLDSAAGCAVQSLLPAGTGYTSLDLHIKFLRRLTVETGPVRAMGTVTHFGKQTALVEARLVNTADRLLATATSSCLVLRQAAG